MNQPAREGFIDPQGQQPGDTAEAPPMRIVQPNYYADPRQKATAEPPPQPQSRPMPSPVMEEPPPQLEETIPEIVWPLECRLVHSKPVRNFRNEILDTLSLRQPTGADINRYGNPVRINQDGDVIIDERKMAGMIAALSGVLLPNIETLDTRDWNSIAYRLRPFFLPEPALSWK